VPPVLAAVPADALETIRAQAPADVDVRAVPPPGDGDLATDLRGVEFLVVHHERPDVVAALGKLESLEVVQVLLSGTDWIVPAIPPGVTLCDAVGSRNEPVAEWIVAALLGYTSGLLRSVRRQDERVWQHFRRDELRGKVVLVVGHGNIGREVARYLEPLGVEVVGVARRPREGVRTEAELPELLPRADAVVLLVPLSDATTRMVDAAFLARMRDDALLVNAGRGALVDTAALVAELEAGRLHAVLDVVDPQPLPADHPLWTLDGVYLSPQIGGDTAQAERRAWRHAGEQLARAARGEPLRNVVLGG
jgi:phosphoglycerate dehydrogenase-like enzyme